MSKVQGAKTAIDYSLLTEKQRDELSRLTQYVESSTRNLGTANSRKEVNKAIQTYFNNLKKNGQLQPAPRHEEPFQPNYNSKMANYDPKSKARISVSTLTMMQ